MKHRLTRILPLALLTLVAVLAAPNAASALPPECEDDPSACMWTEEGTRTLSVSKSGGTITGPGINCGSDCSDSRDVMRSCEVGLGCDDWPGATSWALSASGGPAGYSAQWSNGCGRSPTCTVSAGGPSSGDASASVSLSWVDTTKPSVAFAPPAKVGPKNYTVTASGDDNSGPVHHYVWTVDDIQQAATGATLSLSAIAAGSRTVKVQSVDAAGNASDAISKAVVVDKSVNVTAGALPAITRAATAALTFTTDADVVSRKCSVNNGTAVDCTSGWSGISAATADGSYTYRVTVTDDVGNTKSSDPRTVVVDRTLPAVSFTDGPAEGQQVVTRDAAITFSHADAHPGTLECRLDGVVKPCTAGSAVALADLANGQHAFSVKAVDTAGNERTVTRTFAVQVATDPGTGKPDPGTGVKPTPTPTPAPTTTGGPAPTGPTTTGGAPRKFNPFITGAYGYNAKKTWFTVLRVKKLPADAKVVVSCKGKGCSLKSKKVAHKGGTVNLLKAIKALRVRPGGKVEVRITSADGRVKVARWTARKGKLAKFDVGCVGAGGKLDDC